MADISPLGRLVTSKRMAVGLSVRALARQVGCSHVHLGDLERGQRPLIGEQFWPALATALNVSQSEIESAARHSETIQIDPWLMPPAGETFVHQLARKMKCQDITAEQFRQMLEVLRSREDSEQVERHSQTSRMGPARSTSSSP